MRVALLVVASTVLLGASGGIVQDCPFDARPRALRVDDAVRLERREAEIRSAAAEADRVLTAIDALELGLIDGAARSNRDDVWRRIGRARRTAGGEGAGEAIECAQDRDIARLARWRVRGERLAPLAGLDFLLELEIGRALSTESREEIDARAGGAVAALATRIDDLMGCGAESLHWQDPRVAPRGRASQIREAVGSAVAEVARRLDPDAALQLRLAWATYRFPALRIADCVPGFVAERIVALADDVESLWPIAADSLQQTASAEARAELDAVVERGRAELRALLRQSEEAP